MLSPVQEDDSTINVVIETPQGSRNKFNFDPETGLFKLASVLPKGAIFPFDFGFVPGTLGEDGDPLDILLLMDEPAFCGCLVDTRLIGVIKAEQSEERGVERNDRLIGVATHSKLHEKTEEIFELPTQLLHEIEHFFISYNQAKGKDFKPVGRAGKKEAMRLLLKGVRK